MEQLGLSASVTLTLLKYNFEFIVYFSPLCVTFSKLFAKLKKFDNVGKLLPKRA